MTPRVNELILLVTKGVSTGTRRTGLNLPDRIDSRRDSRWYPECFLVLSLSDLTERFSYFPKPQVTLFEDLL